MNQVSVLQLQQLNYSITYTSNGKRKHVLKENIYLKQNPNLRVSKQCAVSQETCLEKSTDVVAQMVTLLNADLNESVW